MDKKSMEYENTKLYVGAKLIRACPSVKNNVAGYEVVYPDGYVSWAPKDVFENAYREVTVGEKELF